MNHKSILAVILLSTISLVACGGGSSTADNPDILKQCDDEGGCTVTDVSGNFDIYKVTYSEEAKDVPTYSYQGDAQVDVHCGTNDTTDQGFLQADCRMTGDSIYLLCTAGIVSLWDEDDSIYDLGCGNEVSLFCNSTQGFFLGCVE